MIKKDTVLDVYKRAKRQCENDFCLWQKNLLFWWWELHHNYYRSQYKMDDRDESWNLSLLCAVCHRDNQHWVHWKNKKLRKELQRRSDERKPPEERSITPISRRHEVVQKRLKLRKTEEQKQSDRIFARNRRQNQIEIFKSRHNWQTPSQYAYQQKKKYIKEFESILLSNKIKNE